MTGMKAGWPWSPGDVVLLADGALAARSQMNVDNPWTVLTGWRTDAGGGEWLLTDDEITALGPRLVLCETAAVQIALAAEVALAAANRADPNVVDPATGRPAFIGDVRVTGWHVGEAPPVRLRPPVDGSAVEGGALVAQEANHLWRLADNGMMTHESAGAQIAELYAAAAVEADDRILIDCAVHGTTEAYEKQLDNLPGWPDGWPVGWAAITINQCLRCEYPDNGPSPAFTGLLSALADAGTEPPTVTDVYGRIGVLHRTEVDVTDDLWFTDDDTGSQCLLVLEPQLGVEHPDCGRLAKVFVDLDSFWCVACGWRGRVSGAWVLGLAGVGPDGSTETGRGS